jgi:hypothetical protein
MRAQIPLGDVIGFVASCVIFPPNWRQAWPDDVTLQDLHIEAFYPADAASEKLLSSPPWT